MNEKEEAFRATFTAADPDYDYDLDIHLSGYYHWGNEMWDGNQSEGVSPVPGQPVDMGNDYCLFSVEKSGSAGATYPRRLILDLVKLKREEVGYYTREARLEIPLGPTQTGTQVQVTCGLKLTTTTAVLIVGSDNGQYCSAHLVTRDGDTLTRGPSVEFINSGANSTVGIPGVELNNHFLGWATSPSTFTIWAPAYFYDGSTNDSAGIVKRDYNVTQSALVPVGDYEYLPWDSFGEDRKFYTEIQGQQTIDDKFCALYAVIDGAIQQEYWALKLDKATGEVVGSVLLGQENGTFPDHNFGPYGTHMVGGRDKMHVRMSGRAIRNDGTAGSFFYTFMATIDCSSWTLERNGSIDYPPAHPPGVMSTPSDIAGVGDHPWSIHDDNYLGEQPYGSLWCGHGIVQGEYFGSAVPDPFFSLYLWDGEKYTASILLTYGPLSDPNFFPQPDGELPGKTFDVYDSDEMPALAVINEEFVIAFHTFQYLDSPYYVMWVPKVQEIIEPKRVYFTRGRA